MRAVETADKDVMYDTQRVSKSGAVAGDLRVEYFLCKN